MFWRHAKSPLELTIPCTGRRQRWRLFLVYVSAPMASRRHPRVGRKRYSREICNTNRVFKWQTSKVLSSKWTTGLKILTKNCWSGRTVFETKHTTPVKAPSGCPHASICQFENQVGSPVRIAISVVVAQQVVLADCFVSCNFQRLVNWRKEILTQARDLKKQARCAENCHHHCVLQNFPLPWTLFLLSENSTDGRTSTPPSFVMGNNHTSLWKLEWCHPLFSFDLLGPLNVHRNRKLATSKRHFRGFKIDGFLGFPNAQSCSHREFNLTKSIKSVKFFSICCGGSLRIKSSAQSSCWSVCNEEPSEQKPFSHIQNFQHTHLPTWCTSKFSTHSAKLIFHHIYMHRSTPFQPLCPPPDGHGCAWWRFLFFVHDSFLFHPTAQHSDMWMKIWPWRILPSLENVPSPTHRWTVTGKTWPPPPFPTCLTRCVVLFVFPEMPHLEAQNITNTTFLIWMKLDGHTIVDAEIWRVSSLSWSAQEKRNDGGSWLVFTTHEVGPVGGQVYLLVEIPLEYQFAFKHYFLHLNIIFLSGNSLPNPLVQISFRCLCDLIGSRKIRPIIGQLKTRSVFW